ncbi:hypothetical protein G6011_04053 [Alternaria panax]|uniref:FAD-binding PCMH-type domain-containing protein n=1 Tax=Alternaria panax TaxID=48097 RepID=A0AAD4NTM8_9PLEO|nr:hypothetical protein G6011_04053 [Alternaria panax]
MATLANLKRALVKAASANPSGSSTTNSPRVPLTDEQYAAGFSAFTKEPGWAIYRDFIIPELTCLLAPLHNSEALISVLEIGPGPKSVFNYLPESLREKIGRYTAYEPNVVFTEELEKWLGGEGLVGNALEDKSEVKGQEKQKSKDKETDKREERDEKSKIPFTGLKDNLVVHQERFELKDNETSDAKSEKYDIVLFCHSMYGLKPQHKFIEQALEMLIDGGVVAVFHREEGLQIDGLACHHSASYPTGVVGVADNDDLLDHFASFVAGFALQDTEKDKAIEEEWRKVCRKLARREAVHPKTLLFSAPEVMMTFTKRIDAAFELKRRVIPVLKERTVKNKEVRFQHPSTVARPENVRSVQRCVKWALERGLGLTVVGGGHSAQCLRSNVVAIDMSDLRSVYVYTGEEAERAGAGTHALVVAKAGCTTGDIISKALSKGLTVPLGSRPSVGAGLWLQGGIGHLTRLHGLTCDAIVGAIMVSVASGELFYVGNVPSTAHHPGEVTRSNHENDILWALRGAGTNFGVVETVVFKAYTAPNYVVRNWVLPLSDSADARRRLREFEEKVAKGCDHNRSADAYLYWENGRLNLGIMTFETTTSSTTNRAKPQGDIWGTESEFRTLNSEEAFEAEMYMSAMHGGHGGGKTSSFKRCVFFKGIGSSRIAHRLVAAVESRPSRLCYLHLLHGGGKAGEVAPDATAFGCRDWQFACVITGVWPRDEHGTKVARASVQWVYEVVERLLPLSNGIYGADLGPDPRDAALAERAFGLNALRLGRLKRVMDPHNVLAWTCPLPKSPLPKLIILVTGESGVGKDYCAGVWVSSFSEQDDNALHSRHGTRAQVVRISDATKREYATENGADFNRLVEDREYKEEHRSDLTAFYKKQLRRRPRLPKEHFLGVVRAVHKDVDVLFITGMRDDAPVASFSHLVPESRVIEVYVQASEASQISRGVVSNETDLTALRYTPDLIFDNNEEGDQSIQDFAQDFLFPFVHNDLKQLADMVRSIPDFPKPGVQFRHVLGIAQQPGGLTLCATLLQNHFSGLWAEIDAIVCCEVGGLVFAPALATLVSVPLVPIRETGKLPPPTISAIKDASYITGLASCQSKVGKRIEIERGAILGCESVVVVDDVLSTGETLCAVLHLLQEAGVQDIAVMVVAEFPLHCGRELLYERGFGRVRVQSLLVFGGR